MSDHDVELSVNLNLPR